MKNTNKPFAVMLKANIKYYWCACGKSQSQPFCDGSHKSSKLKPIELHFKEDSYINFCGCKKTKNPPYCDGSHRGI